MNENFCYHPWVGLDITPQGGFKPCCKYQNNLAYNLTDYLDSKELSDLRTDFVNGKRPAACSRCWTDEDAGLDSKRTLDNRFIFNQVVDTSKFKVLSVSFGNTCNLACVTCDSTSSSRWSREEKKLQNHNIAVTIAGHTKFYKDFRFLDDLCKISSDLIDITFPGGEPFITGIPQQLSYLDYLIEHNSSNITLTYITNTTTFPSEDFWNRWSKFKQINIHLSIDSIGEKFEYIRWPANWGQCYANIKKYQQFQQSLSNLTLSIGHTVSVFNVFYLPEFFIWCLKEKLPQPHISMVEYPDYYSTKSLPSEVKEKIKNKLSLFSKFNNVISFMMVSNSADFGETQNRIRLLDQHRLQEFNTTFPELIEYRI